MGNYQLKDEPLLIPRRLDAACRSVTRTVPINFCVSYQRVPFPGSSHSSHSPDREDHLSSNQQQQQQQQPAATATATGTADSQQGCLFRPCKTDQPKPVVKRSSFWDYGEFLGDGADSSGDVFHSEAEPTGFLDSKAVGEAGTVETTRAGTVETTARAGRVETTATAGTVETTATARGAAGGSAGDLTTSSSSDDDDECSSQDVRVCESNKSNKNRRAKGEERRSLLIDSMGSAAAAANEVSIPVYGYIQNHQPFLEPQILDSFLPFIMDSTICRCLLVCPHWLRSIYGHLLSKASRTVESFQRLYCQSGKLKYESCCINIQPIFTADSSAVRIDLLIYCKVLRECCNHCVQLGYCFSYASTTPASVSVVQSNRRVEADKQQQQQQQQFKVNININHNSHVSSSNIFSSNCSSDSNGDGVDAYSSQPAVNSMSGGSINSTGSTLHHSLLINDPLASTRLSPEPAAAAPFLSSVSAIIPPKASSYTATGQANRCREYQAQFRFETIKKHAKRHLWVQRDLCRFHGDELMIGAMANVPTVCVDDFVEVPVNMSNAFGIVDLESVEWMPLETVNAPYRQFGQHCQYERSQQQTWVSLDQFQPTTNERLQNNDHFGSHWKHIKTEFTGIDVILSRSEYVACSVGAVPNAKRWLGLDAYVCSANQPILCSLPRLGLQHDRFSSKYFRQGDVIRLYVSQGGGMVI